MTDTAAVLRRLGVEPERPSLDALKRLHRAWVEKVPYESVWIHTGERWGIDPAESLHRIAREARGGYCYQLNGALSLVLAELGYQVTRHVGGVHGPEGPQLHWLTNHLVLIVGGLPDKTNPGGRWHVDVGLGDGLYEPLPLVPGTYRQGPLSFSLERTYDEVGDWHFTHDATGSFSGMSFREPAAEMDAFAARHVHLSTSPESSFAGVVTAQLRHAKGTDILRGCVLSQRRDADSTIETLESAVDWFAALGDVFGIRVTARSEALWARVSEAHERWLASAN